ncbi:MAG TPA: outer membrane beta-barrel domain-containing protein [Bdellovibrionales bacterium]|nr:outer membrane beta-barrel domain-containing protein [Bdellovibrionales bacterium]
MIRALVIFAILAAAVIARAEKVEFPEEELATESVLPTFDQPSAVKKRTVPMEKRLEVGGFLGAGLNEAFFDLTLFGVNAGYHLSDMHGIQFAFAAISAKSSQFVPQLNNVGSVPLNLQYLPQPKWYALLLYEFTPYYGKLSITKQTVINNSVYIVGGIGTVNINNEEQSPALVGGIGQNYYFTKNFGLKLDFRGLLFQSPDPLSVDMSGATETVSTSRFQKQMNFNIAITLGAIFIL